jgi:uncharacterized membrane protein
MLGTDMEKMILFAVAVHVLSAVIWVGGMFFAYVVLRPSMGALDAPPQRLKMWFHVFQRFFVWVWGSIALLTFSGYYLIVAVFGGIANVGMHIHLMYSLAMLMILLFFALYFGPYQRFSEAADAGDWPAAGKILPSIRRIVAINLCLGLITVVIGASGRYWL